MARLSQSVFSDRQADKLGIKTHLQSCKEHEESPQLTKNVSGTFGFGCMKVWLNLTLLERNAYVRRFSYKCLVEPNVLKTLFEYSDSV